MMVFEATLMEELYSSDSMGSNISAVSSVSDLTLIEDYTLAEPYWWVDNWNASGCDGHCISGTTGQQVGEVFCSRGLWLACSGTADRLCI